MLARVTTFQGTPNRLDQAARMIEARVTPKMRQLQGSGGAYWLANCQTTRVLVVAL